MKSSKGEALMQLRSEMVELHLQSQKGHWIAQNLSTVCDVGTRLIGDYTATKGDTEGRNGGWHSTQEP